MPATTLIRAIISYAYSELASHQSLHVTSADKYSNWITTNRDILARLFSTKIDFGRGRSAPDPTEGAYNAPADYLVGFGRETLSLPILYPSTPSASRSRRLRRFIALTLEAWLRPWSQRTCFYPNVTTLYVGLRVFAIVCLSVTLVHPTQRIEPFGNILHSRVPWPSSDLRAKFYGEQGGGVKRKMGSKIHCVPKKWRQNRNHYNYVKSYQN